MLNYAEILNRNLAEYGGERTAAILWVHSVLVTNKALEIARRLGLSVEDQDLITEAGMLHDIGVLKVDSPKMDCGGELPYIAHGVEGGKILREEGARLGINLEPHAKVAERHVGVGLTAKEIAERNLPLPMKDFVPETQVEKIITYADLFFSKREASLWQMESVDEIVAELAGFGAEQVETFKAWQSEFGE